MREFRKDIPVEREREREREMEEEKAFFLLARSFPALVSVL